MNANSGYVGFSRSVRSAEAEAEGKMPLSRAISAVAAVAGCTKKQARDFLAEIGPCEWHHTSKKFNKTNYYNVSAAVDRALANHHVIAMKAVGFVDLISDWPVADKNSLDCRCSAMKDACQHIASLVGCDASLVETAYYGTWGDES